MADEAALAGESMRKGLEAIEEQIDRVTPYWERGEADYWGWEQQYMRPDPPPKPYERKTCTCPPWAVDYWDGPDPHCPDHGCCRGGH